MNPVNDRPFLPQVVPSTFDGINKTFGELVRVLLGVFSDFGYRVNNVLPKDGTEAMTAPLTLATYTTATLPAAADYPGALIYVSDAAAGAKFQGSDGTSWVSLG